MYQIYYGKGLFYDMNSILKLSNHITSLIYKQPADRCPRAIVSQSGSPSERTSRYVINIHELSLPRSRVRTAGFGVSGQGRCWAGFHGRRLIFGGIFSLSLLSPLIRSVCWASARLDLLHHGRLNSDPSPKSDPLFSVIHLDRSGNHFFGILLHLCANVQTCSLRQER